MIKLLKKPTGALFALVVAMVGGLFVADSLSISMYPSIQKPVIHGWIPSPGVSSQELYDSFSADIAQALKLIEDRKKTTVEYFSGGIDVTIEFGFDKDRKLARQESILAFDGIKSKLPEDQQRRMWFGYWDNGQGVFGGGLGSTENRSLKELYEVVQPVVEETVRRLEDADPEQTGMEQVDLKDIVIEFDEIALAKHGLFLPNLIRTLRSQIGNVSSGKISKETETVLIRTIVNENKIEDFKKIIIAVKVLNVAGVQSTRVIHLEDVAKVYSKIIPPKRIWRVQGQPAMMIFATGKPGGNLLRLSENIKKIMQDAMKEKLPKDIIFRTFLDPSVFIRKSINSMLSSAFAGTFIATLIIFLFLGQLSSTGLIAISIPASIISSFFLMKLFDININLISLGGMALAVGMIVDSSIVVLENIFRHFELNPPKDKREKIERIVEATKEVRWSVIVSTLTSVIVFLPLSYTAAMTNAVLGDMSKVVVFALMISIVTALIYLPILALVLIRTRKKSPETSRVEKWSERWNSWVERLAHKLYLGVVKSLTKNRTRALIACGSIFAVFTIISMFLWGDIKKEIIAEPDAAIFSIRAKAKFVNDRDKLLELVEPYEKLLETEKYADRLQAVITRARNNTRAKIFAIVKDDVDVNKIKQDLEDDFESTPDLDFRVGSWNPTTLPLPETWDVFVSVKSTDSKSYADAIALCKEIDDILEESGEDRKVWAYCEPDISRPNEIQVHPEKLKLERMARELGMNFSPRDIATYIKTATQESFLARILFEGNPTNVYARYPEDSVDNIEKIQNLIVSFGQDPAGLTRSFPLKTFARIQSKKGESSLREENGNKSVILRGKLRERFKDQQKEAQKLVAAAIEKAHAENKHLKALARQENPYQDVDDSVDSLVFSLLLSVILVLVLLVMQFQSVKRALIIMLAIPLGIFGVIISLAVFKSTISLNSMLGVILLSGVAVNNSILIMDFYLSGLASGISAREALLEAIRIRFRPILMTMLTTILAMLPIAMNLGSGGKTLQPLGIAISGGLLTSTVFTLLVVPLVIFLVDVSEREVKS